MQLLPQEKPSPRLLNTVVPDSYGLASQPTSPQSRSALLKGALFSGNGLAIFVGLILACFLVAGANWLHERKMRADRIAPVPPTLMPASTSSISSSAQEVAPPAPIMVRISAENIRVSAISLGHPRLAVINDQQVAEGDLVAIRASPARIQVKLRVTKIADGRVELTDGTQTIVTQLSLATAKATKP